MSTPAATLSQKDIDSLLKGGARPSKGTSAAEVIPYNFLRPPRISKDRRATLESIHSRFALSLQSLLSSRLRQPTDVTIAGVEQVTFSEYVLSLSNPCAAFVLALGDRLSTQVVIDLGAEMASHLVDRLFGGPGDTPVDRRPLTALEQLVVRGVVERIAGLLQESWGEHLPMTPVLGGFEHTPETLQIANREDNVLVSNVEVRAGAFSGLLSICMPLVALEAFLQEKSGPLVQGHRAPPSEREQARKLVEAHLRRAEIAVAARLPQVSLRARDLTEMRPGAVLLTGQPANNEIELLVSGRRRFLGTLGKSDGYVGVNVTRRLAEDPSADHVRTVRGRIVHE